MKRIAGTTLACMAVFVLTGIALPAGIARADEPGPEAAGEWPNAGTPLLEVTAGGYMLSFPAPGWIDRAKWFVDELDDDNVDGDWFTSGAIGSPRETKRDWLSVQNVDLENWRILDLHVSNDLTGPCVTLDPPAQGDNERALRLCQAPGANAGAIFYGIQQYPGEGRAVVAAYKTATPPFVLADETTWPMSRDELIAMADRIDGLITITPAP